MPNYTSEDCINETSKIILAHQFKELKDSLLHGNTPLHYCILGCPVQERRIAGETLESAVDRQCKTLERLVFPKAFIIQSEESISLHVADLGKANANGLTALQLAASHAVNALIPILLSWDLDYLYAGSPQQLATIGSLSPDKKAFFERMFHSKRGDGFGSKRTPRRGSMRARGVASLSNLHNPLTGDTPLLACLRALGEPLRRKEEERTKRDETAVVNGLETARRLITHANTDVFRSGLTVTREGRNIQEGGPSPLLFLLCIGERLRIVEFHVTEVERKNQVKEAKIMVDELAVTLVARAESPEQLDKLCMCLFELHDPKAWRVFGGNATISCLELALRSNHRNLITSHWVQEALHRAWYRSSRYNFWLSLGLFVLLVIATTFVGYQTTGNIGLHRSIDDHLIASMETAAEATQWNDWLVNVFVPTVAPPWASGASQAAPWYSIDALRIHRRVHHVTTCGQEDLPTAPLCAEMLTFEEDASIDIPLYDVLQAQDLLRSVAANWTTAQLMSLGVTANLYSPLESTICQFQASVHVSTVGKITLDHEVNSIQFWRPQMVLMISQAIVTAGMLISCFVQGRDLAANGPLYLLHFWNAVDFLHNMVFVFSLLLFLFELAIDVQPTLFQPSTHESLSLIMTVHFSYITMVSLLVLLAWGRLMKYLRMLPRVGILVEVILVIVRQLSAFSVLFCVLWVGITSAALPMFGDHVEELSTLSSAAVQMLQSLVSTSTLAGKLAAEGPVGLIFSIGVNVFLALIITNLLIAILTQSYSDTVAEAQQAYLMLQAELTLSFYIRSHHRAEVRLDSAEDGTHPVELGSPRSHNRAQIVAAPTSSMSNAPSAQLQKYLQDESKGLQALHEMFLWRMESSAFGDALSKLRYIRQVFLQCSEDVDAAASWMENHALAMLTPQLETAVVQITLRFPSVIRLQALALLQGPCNGSVSMATELLTGKRTLSMYEEMMLKKAGDDLQTRVQLEFTERAKPQARAVDRGEEPIDDSFTQDREGSFENGNSSFVQTLINGAKDGLRMSISGDDRSFAGRRGSQDGDPNNHSMNREITRRRRPSFMKVETSQDSVLDAVNVPDREATRRRRPSFIKMNTSQDPLANWGTAEEEASQAGVFNIFGWQVNLSGSPNALHRHQSSVRCSVNGRALRARRPSTNMAAMRTSFHEMGNAQPGALDA